jgi:hypothetical protein
MGGGDFDVDIVVFGLVEVQGIYFFQSRLLPATRFYNIRVK